MKKTLVMILALCLFFLASNVGQAETLYYTEVYPENKVQLDETVDADQMAGLYFEQTS